MGGHFVSFPILVGLWIGRSGVFAGFVMWGGIYDLEMSGVACKAQS
ncbi:hypothetical protein BN1012_Phect1234 [Candidatus Phaeomarinobacter ectocarpi]|uniref:Uncharacterized protein n=1 Tax=Candidatus Phaeomarinibacter ectocarpi TaxID=1458461 RepID=X5M856_9HYPH|nr:hypothetical protein BN1012_Phect1234 [Candidatus Phaeomarinobacter ectocarpi]